MLYSSYEVLQLSCYRGAKALDLYHPMGPSNERLMVIFRGTEVDLVNATGIRGDSLPVTSIAKVWGFLMDSSFSPSIHRSEAAFKPSRVLLIIRRSFAELSVSAFAPLDNTLVRSHLENAVQVCSRNLVAGADCLQRIQQLATRLEKGFGGRLTSSAGYALL